MTVVWSKLVRVAGWILIGLFGILGIAHVVLMALFYTGVQDQGYGYFLDYQWPGWLIVVLDVLVVLLVLFVRREGDRRPWPALGATILVAAIVVGRALWMVIPPALAAILVVDAARRVARRSPAV